MAGRSAAGEVDRDRLARDWLGYALRWADRRRRRHGDAIDWEQAALHGLAQAVRYFGGGSGETFSRTYIDRCLATAAGPPLRRARRWAAHLPRVAWRRADGRPQDPPDPAAAAALAAVDARDEVARLLARMTPAERRMAARILADRPLDWADRRARAGLRARLGAR